MPIPVADDDETDEPRRTPDFECERCGAPTEETEPIQVYCNILGWYEMHVCNNCACRHRGDD